MTIHNTAFDTTAGAGYAGRVKSITIALKEAEGLNLLRPLTFNLTNIDYTIGMMLVCGGHAKVDSIPSFNHPIVSPGSVGQTKTYLDARNFGRWNKAQETFSVNNPDELLWNIRRGVLQHLWMNEIKNTFRDISILPMKVYCNLIAEVVQRRYGLNPAEKMRVAIAAAYGYLSFFSDDETHDFDKVSAKISQAIGAYGREMCDEVLMNIDPVHDIESLCNCIVKSSQSVRLEEFNAGILMSLIAGTWFGTNARENICVALEHMPTWLMIVWAACSEATFKRSQLSKMVQQYDTKNQAEAFSQAMNTLTGNISVQKLSEI